MTAATERLAEIEGRAEGATAASWRSGDQTIHEDVPAMAKALRAVLALHRTTPYTQRSTGGGTRTSYFCVECSTDETDVLYPCPTVTAITAALGCEAGK